MSKTLFIKEIKSNYKLLLIFISVLAMYAIMIVAMFDPTMGESLELMSQSMPGVFAAFGMLDVGATMLEFLANYLYGFLLVVFPLVFIAIIANKLVVKYVESGSMAYLLATPNKRLKIVITQAVELIFSVFMLVVISTLLCIVSSEIMFAGELDIPKFLIINVGLLGLNLFFASICFFTSCIFNDAKKSNAFGTGILILFVLIQMVSQVGEKFEKLKYATPLTLFNTDGIIAGDTWAIISFCILYAVAAVFFVAGISAFCKRDLPI